MDKPGDGSAGAGVSESNPTEGLPDDLAALLRDPRIIVPQDQRVWELIAEWANAPSDTPSAIPYQRPDSDV